MKKATCVFLFLLIVSLIFATEQEDDILYFNGLKLNLYVDWGHPSPLQKYYYQNQIEYPFWMSSTANYRGHIAQWQLRTDSLILDEILRWEHPKDHDQSFPPPLPVLYRYKPLDFYVYPAGETDKDTSEVFAEWFSGVIKSSYIETVEDSMYTSYYFFQIEHGIMQEMQIISSEEYDLLYADHFSAMNADSELREKFKMLIRFQNYMTYYFRLPGRDTIIFNNETLLLRTDWQKLSPIYVYFDNDHLKWPFNWNNLTETGAPGCKWIILNDSLYLTDVAIFHGLSFFQAEKSKIDWHELLGFGETTEKVFAENVNGAFMLQKKVLEEDDFEDAIPIYNKVNLKLIMIRNGILVETFELPRDNMTDREIKALDNPIIQEFFEGY